MAAQTLGAESADLDAAEAGIGGPSTPQLGATQDLPLPATGLTVGTAGATRKRSREADRLGPPAVAAKTSEEVSSPGFSQAPSAEDLTTAPGAFDLGSPEGAVFSEGVSNSGSAVHGMVRPASQLTADARENFQGESQSMCAAMCSRWRRLSRSLGSRSSTLKSRSRY